MHGGYDRWRQFGVLAGQMRSSHCPRCARTGATVTPFTAASVIGWSERRTSANAQKWPEARCEKSQARGQQRTSRSDVVVIHARWLWLRMHHHRVCYEVAQALHRGVEE